MNRFKQRSLRERLHLRLILLPAIFLLLLFLLIFSLNEMDRKTKAEQARNLENAVMSSIAQCYALEGSYPPNLTYLEEHYGLTYNSDLYFVDYQPLGSNLLPDVTIIIK